MATGYTYTQKNILNLYALIATGAVLSFIPITLLPVAGMACLIIGFMAAYIYRFKDRADQFVHYHTTYLIRTLWLSSLILIGGVILFGCLVFFNGDLSALMRVQEASEKGIVPTDDDIRIMQAKFVHGNQTLILWSAAVSVLPFLIFVLWRVVRGVAMIKKEPKLR